MRRPDRAREALGRADRETDEIDRSVWLAKAADHAISSVAVLVGGAAVNLHTRQYRPTDVDMCAYLDESDRQSLISVGFEHLQGDRFAYTFSDGERWLIEFPDSQVDGDVMIISLDGGETLAVISLESLVVDRIQQATDGTQVTFDEAVRVCYALTEYADWSRVGTEIERRAKENPLLKLPQTYQRVLDATQTLLDRSS